MTRFASDLKAKKTRALNNHQDHMHPHTKVTEVKRSD